MLGNARIMAFAATADPARARAFYGDTLGLRLTEQSEYALVFDAGGTMLRVQIVSEVLAPPYTALGWEVADIHAAINDLKSRGVAFERYPWMQQDESGVWASPSGASIAWFTDPEGHILSLTQLPR